MTLVESEPSDYRRDQRAIQATVLYFTTMPALYKVQIRTHAGGVREINEDTVSTVLDWRSTLGLTDEDLRSRGHLFAVADGMGGHAAGDVASKVAMETVFRTYYTSSAEAPEAALRAAIAEANRALLHQAEIDLSYAGLGTTFVAALLLGTELIVANVGDSRAYLFQAGHLQQITQDHSWVAEQIAAGVLTHEEAARHPYRNVITRSLGPDREPAPDFFRIDLQPGDVLLLCSDGLSNMIKQEEISAFLSAYPCDEAADVLLERTLERGAPDNVSFVLVEFLGQVGERPRRIWPWFVLSILTVALLAFLYRGEVAALLPASATAESVASPSAQPAASPLRSSLPSPTIPSLSIPAPVAEPLRVGSIDLGAGQATDLDALLSERFGQIGGSSIRRPQRNQYIFYLQGPVASSRRDAVTWALTIPHQTPQGERIEYQLEGRGEWRNGDVLPAAGDRIGAIAQPITEGDITGEIDLEPLIVIAPGPDNEVLWMTDRDRSALMAKLDPTWVFSVYGPGGGEGLGLTTPPSILGLGRPIALWGQWLQTMQEPPALHFELLDRTPYEWDDNVYRQPNN